MSGYLDPTGVCSTLSRDDPLWTCAGCNLGSVSSYNEWLSLNCPLQFRPLYSQPIGSSAYPQLSGENTARLYANNLLETYFDSGVDDAFEDVLHRFCNNPSINPGICQNYLQYKKCPQYSYNDLNSDEADWCGCFVMPPEDDQQIYGENVACYPLCHQTSTIQLVDSNNRLIQCDNQVCIIDGVTVNITDSRTGDVNFNQICPGCSGNCSCTINDVDVVGANLNINQYCGPNTKCWKTINGELVQVACGSGEWIDKWLLWIVIAIVIIVVFIVLMIAIYQAVRYSS
jgi:hypothetical protein